MTDTLLYTILIILFIHWIADFLFQSRKMADRKYENWSALSLHIGVYTLTLLIGTVIFLPLEYKTNLVLFCALNGGLHFVIDALTSRATHELYTQGKVHWFFTVIGLDQFMHTALLFTTLSVTTQ